MEKTQVELIYCTQDREVLEGGRNNENVVISRWDLWILSRFSIAFRKFTQFFPPVICPQAIDAESADLSQYGLKLVRLSGQTQNDLCVIWGDKVFCGDICMNGAGASIHSPMWIEDNQALCDSWEKLLSLGDATLYPAHGKPFDLKELNRCLPKQRKRKVYRLKKNA